MKEEKVVVVAEEDGRKRSGCGQAFEHGRSFQKEKPAEEKEGDPLHRDKIHVALCMGKMIVGEGENESGYQAAPVGPGHCRGSPPRIQS